MSIQIKSRLTLLASALALSAATTAAFAASPAYQPEGGKTDASPPNYYGAPERLVPRANLSYQPEGGPTDASPPNYYYGTDVRLVPLGAAPGAARHEERESRHGMRDKMHEEKEKLHRKMGRGDDDSERQANTPKY